MYLCSSLSLFSARVGAHCETSSMLKIHGKFNIISSETKNNTFNVTLKDYTYDNSREARPAALILATLSE